MLIAPAPAPAPVAFATFRSSKLVAASMGVAWGMPCASQQHCVVRHGGRIGSLVRRVPALDLPYCLPPTAMVILDGLGCFEAVTNAGCFHRSKTVEALKPPDLPELKWINTALGNLKAALAGAIKARKFRKYAETCLAAFAYGFKQRFGLRSLVTNLFVEVVQTRPMRR